MDLIIPYLWLAAGLAALVFCGNWLVTGGVQLAHHFKVSALIVGLTIVAFGTSAPELFVSIEAAIKGSPDIALGNVIGSNIANIALVLGLTALICPIPILNKSIGFDLVVMVAVTTLLFVLGYNGIFGLIEGICLTSILIVYTVWSIRKEKKKSAAKEMESATIRPLISILIVIASIAGLYFGSDWFIRGARDIALQWGVSERVIGLTIVAVGTSLPELMASVIAAVRKEMDISIGNIIGSNIFNITMVLGVTSVIHPLKITDQKMFTTDVLWAFGITIIMVLAMLPLSKGKISRWKGAVFLLLYVVYVFTLFRSGRV